MSETYGTSFAAGVNAYVRNYILAAVCDYLREKNITVTVDELADKALSLPPARTVQSNLITPNPIGFGGKSVAPTVVSNVESSRKITPLDEPIEGKCQYKLQRGFDKNKFCSKPVAPGQFFCNSCAKRPAGQKQLRERGLIQESAAPGVNPKASTSSTVSSKKEPGLTTGVSAGEPGQADSLNVLPIPGYKEYYRDPLTQFVVQEEEDGIYVIGKYIDNKIVKLSPDDEQLAKHKGMKIKFVEEFEEKQQEPSSGSAVTKPTIRGI